MTDMIQVCSNFHSASAFIINTCPHEIPGGAKAHRMPALSLAFSFSLALSSSVSFCLCPFIS